MLSDSSGRRGGSPTTTMTSIDMSLSRRFGCASMFRLKLRLTLFLLLPSSSPVWLSNELTTHHYTSSCFFNHSIPHMLSELRHFPKKYRYCLFIYSSLGFSLSAKALLKKFRRTGQLPQTHYGISIKICVWYQNKNMFLFRFGLLLWLTMMHRGACPTTTTRSRR